MCCFSVACEWVVTAVLIDLDLSLCSKPDNTQCHSLVGSDALLFHPCISLNNAYTNFIVLRDVSQYQNILSNELYFSVLIYTHTN